MSNTENFPSLGKCLAMDAIGVASYLVPGIGESFDLVWFLVQGIVFYKWFGSAAGAIGAACEELAPFTDFIPSFTIGYFKCRE